MNFAAMQRQYHLSRLFVSHFEALEESDMKQSVSCSVRCICLLVLIGDQVTSYKELAQAEK
jgi:hypothetical protein